jgi:hypothetical protein
MRGQAALVDRKRPNRGLLVARWVLPLGAAVSAIPLTTLAYDTGFDLRDQDPCATGWDNIWSLSSSAVLWVALVSAVVFVVLAVRGRRTTETSLGIVAIVGILALSVACWIYANGAYGWDCV